MVLQLAYFYRTSSHWGKSQQSGTSRHMLTVSATLSLFHRKTSMLHCRFNTDLQNEAHPRHLCFKNADPFHSRGLCPLSPSLRLSGVPFLDDAHVLRPRILNSRACSRCPRCDTLGTSRHASVAPAS